jgi:hypothetical protein
MSLVGLACVVCTFAFPTDSARARVKNQACGKIGGIPIHAHGVSCQAARQVYRANMRGGLPSGWTCSASLARCYKGGFSSGRFMWWKRTTYRSLRQESDSRTLIACLTEGRFDYLVRPRKCDLLARTESGGVLDIRTRGLRWTEWGRPQATANGWDSVGNRLTVTAYRRVHCGGSVAIYGLARVVRASGRTYHLKLAKCRQR